MKTNLSVFALSLLTALQIIGKMNLGDAVRCPSELSSVAVGTLQYRDSIGLNGGTYRAICALGDRSVERMLAPSLNGYHAPSSKLECMASTGWEVPRAAEHTELYRLAYAWMTNAVAYTLPDGLKVYPAVFFTVLSVYPDNEWKTVTEGLHSVVDMNLTAGVGNIFGGVVDDSIIDDVDLVLSRHYMNSGRTQEKSTINDSARAALWAGMVPITMGNLQAEFEGSNIIARGGIKSGDPLYSLDPFACDALLNAVSHTPVLSMSGFIDTITNQVFVATYSNVVSAATFNTVVRNLIMTGSGTEREATLDTQTIVSNSVTRAAGSLQNSFDEVYSYGSSKINAYVKARVNTSSHNCGWWIYSTNRVSNPTAGNLYVYRMMITNTTSYTVVGGGANAKPFCRIKEVTRTKTYPYTYNGIVLKECSFPVQEDYKAKSRGARVFIFDSYQSERQTASEDTSPSSIAYSYHGVWEDYFAFYDQPFREGLSYQYESMIGSVYLEHGDSYVPTFGDLIIDISMPTLGTDASSTSKFKSIFVPDDPTVQLPEGFSQTNFFGRAWSEDYEPGVEINPSTGKPTGEGVSIDTQDPSQQPTGDGVTVDIKCPSSIRGQGMGYTVFEHNVLYTPTVLALIPLAYWTN